MQVFFFFYIVDVLAVCFCLYVLLCHFGCPCCVLLFVRSAMPFWMSLLCAIVCMFCYAILDVLAVCFCLYVLLCHFGCPCCVLLFVRSVMLLLMLMLTYNHSQDICFFIKKLQCFNTCIFILAFV